MSGELNNIDVNVVNSTIVGGLNNTIRNNGPTLETHSFIGGGNNNTVDFEYSSILGGNLNTIHAAFSVIIGGSNNTIDVISGSSAIGGGLNNTISERSPLSIIGGGINNLITADIGLSSPYNVIGGGENHVINNSNHSVILGGSTNSIVNSTFSSIVGGNNNAIPAGAQHVGVFGDGTFTNFLDNGFNVNNMVVTAMFDATFLGIAGLAPNELFFCTVGGVNEVYIN